MNSGGGGRRSKFRKIEKGRGSDLLHLWRGKKKERDGRLLSLTPRTRKEGGHAIKILTDLDLLEKKKMD